MKLTSTLVVTAAAIVAMAGCGADSGLGPEIPDSPDGTVEAVLDGLVDHRPDVAWRALPPSYQADVARLTQLFADSVDPVLFDRAIAVSRKTTMVLQSKKELILASDTFARSGIDPEEVDAGWESAVRLVDEVLASELADLDSLRELDVEAFLSGTGGSLMDHAAAMPNPDGDTGFLWSRLEAMREARVELDSLDGDEAVVVVSAPKMNPVELEMRRVEGRWIPAELADEWPDAVAEVEESIAELGGEEGAQTTMQLLFGLGMVETLVDQIDRMERPEDFDNLVGGLVGAFLQSQAGQVVTEG